MQQLLHEEVGEVGAGPELQVRETSRKPDELYSLLERLSPGTRKLVRQLTY